MLELLNTKSCLDCMSEEELNAHNSETAKFLVELTKNPEYRWIIATYRYVGPVRTGRRDITTCRATEVMDLLNLVDHENGIDLAKDHKGYVVLRAFGQGYQQDDKHHYTETWIRLIPWGDPDNN